MNATHPPARRRPRCRRRGAVSLALPPNWLLFPSRTVGNPVRVAAARGPRDGGAALHVAPARGAPAAARARVGAAELGVSVNIVFEGCEPCLHLWLRTSCVVV